VSLVEEGVQRYCGSGRVIKECTPKSVAWPGLKPTPPPPLSTSPVEWPSNRYDRPSILAEWLFEDFMTSKG